MANSDSPRARWQVMRPLVRYLCWLGDGWHWGYLWLVNDWHGNDPAALRAS